MIDLSLNYYEHSFETKRYSNIISNLCFYRQNIDYSIILRHELVVGGW